MPIEANLPENLRRTLQRHVIFADHIDRALSHLDAARDCGRDIRLSPDTAPSADYLAAIRAARAFLLVDKAHNDAWIRKIEKRLGIVREEPSDEMGELRRAALSNGRP